MNHKANTAVLFAWLIALIGMSLSLYASEIAHWEVCKLCWYQRICLYPLVLLLGMSAFKNDTAIVPYALPLPILGALFSLYQYLEQMIPGFSPVSFCTITAPCSVTHFKIWGFITIPLISLGGFLVITALLFYAKKNA